jgi:hypothetical protein
MGFLILQGLGIVENFRIFFLDFEFFWFGFLENWKNFLSKVLIYKNTEKYLFY